MERLKLTLAYTGTAYAGWQIQAETQEKSTVQKELENAFARITGGPVRVHGAGRTDSGVHAEGQVAHVDVPEKSADWRASLNALLPPDIRVLRAERAHPSFHARHDAAGKLYAYTLHMGREPVSPRLAPYVWATPLLDAARMEEAASALTGRHDYASFQNAGTDIADTVRSVWNISRADCVAGPLLCPAGWPVATWLFYGQGFLKQMVRNLMGLMVYAGLGKTDAAGVKRFLEAGDRRALPSMTAPAKGLTLLRVDYPE